MTQFGSPFVAMNADRKLTHGEIIRTIRFSIADEFEAIQAYMQLHESIDDKLVRKVLVDIANEEKEHVGEFLRLLRYVNPEEEQHYKKGEEEVEEMIRELGKG